MNKKIIIGGVAVIMVLILLVAAILILRRAGTDGKDIDAVGTEIDKQLQNLNDQQDFGDFTANDLQTTATPEVTDTTPPSQSIDDTLKNIDSGTKNLDSNKDFGDFGTL